MNKSDVDAVMLFARGLWPAWKPDEADVEAWERLLSRGNSPDVARQALRELKDTTDWKGPKRAQFLDLMARQSPRPRELENEGDVVFPGFIGNPETGEFLPLAYAGEWPAKDVQYRDLTRMCEDRQRIYGGTWQIIRAMDGQPISYADMVNQRNDIRKAKPLRRRDSAKRPTPLKQALHNFFAQPPTLDETDEAAAHEPDTAEFPDEIPF